MTRNIPIVPILWVAGTVLGVGATAYGAKAAMDQASERQAAAQQAAQQQQVSANVQSLQTQMMLEQMTPLLVLGTVAMAGIGALLLVRSK